VPTRTIDVGGPTIGGDVTDDLHAKLQAIKAVVTDVDGCLTDGTIIFGDGFHESKSFDVKDGLGVTLANGAGLVTAIITGRTSHAVARRARELRFAETFQGFEDKRGAWDALKSNRNLSDHEIAYLGDDLLDLCLLNRCGVSFAPADAVAEVRSRVDVVLERQGGHGALREMIETILKAQSRWDDIVNRYSSA